MKQFMIKDENHCDICYQNILNMISHARKGSLEEVRRKEERLQDLQLALQFHPKFQGMQV